MVVGLWVRLPGLSWGQVWRPFGALLLALCVLAWVPVASAQLLGLAGIWDTTAVVSAGPDNGSTFLGELRFTSGNERLAGTFRATVNGIEIEGGFGGTQTDGRISGSGTATSPRRYQLLVEATIASDSRTFLGTWSDSDGRSGTYRGVRRSAALPAAGHAPWELLIAAWALLGAAMLSRGARNRLR